MSQTLYRMFDRSGTLLYVGITQRQSRRFREHAKDKPWWRDVHTVTVEHFEDRASVEQAEFLAIKTERPIHNVTHGTARPGALRAPGDVLSFEAHPSSSPDRYGEYFWLVEMVNGDTVALYADSYEVVAGALVFHGTWQPKPPRPLSVFAPGTWKSCIPISCLSGEPVHWDWAREVK